LTYQCVGRQRLSIIVNAILATVYIVRTGLELLGSVYISFSFKTENEFSFLLKMESEHELKSTELQLPSNNSIHDVS